MSERRPICCSYYSKRYAPRFLPAKFFDNSCSSQLLLRSNRGFAYNTEMPLLLLFE